MILLNSPNNPTSLIIPEEKILSYLKEGILVVIDEAYVEYSSQSLIPLLNQFENLILIRTFSKAWGLAGIRVGYALTSAEKGLELLENMLPYNVNSFSMNMAMASIEKKEVVEKVVDITIRERGNLYDELEDLGFNPLPSDTNFLLCKTPAEIEAKELLDKLLRRGIKIKTFENDRLKDYIRITVGDESINQVVLDNIKQAIEDM